MEKGKYGIRVAFYGVLAFVLAFLGFSTPLFLLLGVVLLAEKNEWATKQVLQAILIYVAARFVMSAINVLDFVTEVSVLVSAWYFCLNILNYVMDIIVAVLCIMGIVNNVKGRDANIPLISSIVNWAYGIVTVKPVQPQYQQQYQQPVQQQYQQPVQPQYQQPVQQQYQQPVQPQYQQPVQQQNNQQ